MNKDLKKIVDRIKETQTQLHAILKERAWVDDARKFADKQRKEVHKLFEADLSKVKTFIERERKEFGKLQKQIPGELKKFKKLVDGQKKELEKILGKLGKTKLPKRPFKKTAAGTKGKGSKSASANSSA